MKVFKKILNTLVTILIVLVLVVSIFVAVFALTSKSSGISTIFGNTIQVIQSDSMKGGYQGSEGYTGGNFEKGDVIIGKATEFVNDAKYEVGDIVTYKGFLTGAEDMGQQLICHRIVAVSKDGTMYQTKGDNNQVAEIPDQKSPEEGIVASDIGAVFHSKNFDGKVLKGVGNFLDFITSQMGFFICVLLPMIVFFLYELIRVVLNVAGYKKAKQEDMKEEMRKEFEEKYGVQNAQYQAQPVAAQTYVDPSYSNQPLYQNQTDVNYQQNPVTQPVQNVQPVQEQPNQGMSAEEYKQFQEFQEFKRMQQMYNQQNNADENSGTPE